MAKGSPDVVEILPEAWDDLREGVEFYDEQSVGLGDRFMEEMIVQLQGLTERPGTHSHRFGHFFALAKIWPWAMYYLIEENCIVVMAVLDCRRDPNWIKQRLTGE